MERVPSADPTRVLYRTAWRHRIFRFVIMGAAFPFALIQARNDGMPLWAASLPFALVLGLGVWRQVFDVDLHDGAWEYRRGPLFTLFRQRGSLAEFDRVLLSLNGPRSSAYDTFIVALKGKDQRRLGVFAGTYAGVGPAAYEIANALGLPLEDQGLELPCAGVEERQPPGGLRSRVEIGSREIQAHIGTGGFYSAFAITGVVVLSLALLVAICSIAYLLAGGPLMADSWSAPALAPVVGGLFIAGLLVPICLRTWRIEASQEGIEVMSRLGPIRLRTWIAAEDVLAIGIIIEGPKPKKVRPILPFGGRPIVVLGRRKAALFGWHLPFEEKLWIAALLRRAVAGRLEPARS